MTERKPVRQVRRRSEPGTGRPPSDHRDPLPDHLPRWLEAVSRRLSAELGAQLRGPSGELRGSHRRILQMIPPEGIRITDLAALAGMTKQSLGEFVDGLERTGFVVSRRHEVDGRVRIVSRTQSGDVAAEEAQAAIAAVEQRWRTELGADRYDAMFAALRDLGRDVIRF
jgi:DNA-binding MarR family transcriptional regulator